MTGSVEGMPGGDSEAAGAGDGGVSEQRYLGYLGTYAGCQQLNVLDWDKACSDGGSQGCLISEYGEKSRRTYCVVRSISTTVVIGGGRH